VISAIVLVIALAGGGLAATVAGAIGGTAAPAAAPTTAPDPSVAEGRTWTSTLTTSAGDITVELDGAAAPQAVASFVTLAQAGFFDATACHRLTTAGIFVLQCGDPTGTGGGGPGFTFGPIENAPANDFYPAGTIAMARRGNDGASMGSQFFLVYQDSTIPSDAAGGYTVLGRITSGLDVVQAVADAGVAGGASDGAPATPVTIEGVEVQ
jgi:peptidyl-prolyl cis-trans isomerase B (cyclophilin B)